MGYRRPIGHHKIAVRHLAGFWSIEIRPPHAHYPDRIFGTWTTARAFAALLNRKFGWLIADLTPTELRIDQKPRAHPSAATDTSAES